MHMDVKHGRYKCCKCEKPFWENDDLLKHMNDEHPAISIKCKNCEFKGPSMYSLMEHKKGAHNFICKHYNWVVLSKDELKKHMEHVHGVDDTLKAQDGKNKSKSVSDDTYLKKYDYNEDTSATSNDEEIISDDEANKGVFLEIENAKLLNENKYLKIGLIKFLKT